MWGLGFAYFQGFGSTSTSYIDAHGFDGKLQGLGLKKNHDAQGIYCQPPTARAHTTRV